MIKKKTTLFLATTEGILSDIEVHRFNERSVWLKEGRGTQDRLVRFTNTGGYFESLEEASEWAAAKLKEEVSSREMQLGILASRLQRLESFNQITKAHD
jgi:hypothetical protein